MMSSSVSEENWMAPVWDTLLEARTAEVSAMLCEGARSPVSPPFPVHQFSQMTFVIPLTQNLAFGVSAQLEVLHWLFLGIQA